MTRTLHARAFAVSVVWTLFLLLLGSVVHATGSSLACPDWPTCFGTMVPAMEGGVFWEHLHRLVAGGLILMWGLATWLAWRERAPAPVVRGAVAGLGLLVVQAVFGGVTVLLRLPPAVSSTHLALALVFLALATTLWVESAERGSAAGTVPPSPDARATFRAWGGAAAAVVFVQSLLGAAVRHMQAGVACPDLPLCLGRVVPPVVSPLVAVHFAHRVAALLTAAVVIAAAVAVARAAGPGSRARGWAWAAGGLVVVQVGLGVLSVASLLAVVPVSLHSLVAAALLVVLVAVWAEGGAHQAPSPGGRSVATPYPAARSVPPTGRAGSPTAR